MVAKVVAGILLLLGIVMIIAGIAQDSRHGTETAVYISSGIVCLLSSALQFILANMANDIHQMNWRMDLFFKADRDRMKAALNYLQSIDGKMSPDRTADQNAGSTYDWRKNDPTDKTSFTE